MLEKTRDDQNSRALLVGMENGTTILENIWAVS